jgi:hypothetical protein
MIERFDGTSAEQCEKSRVAHQPLAKSTLAIDRFLVQFEVAWVGIYLDTVLTNYFYKLVGRRVSGLPSDQ